MAMTTVRICSANIWNAIITIEKGMNFLSQTIQSQVKISPDILQEIVSHFERVEVPRKAKLVQAGEVAQKLACIEKGYLRMYKIDPEGNETTIWIGGPGKFITSISSFIHQKPSLWNIEALTPGEVYLIKRDSHFQLCEFYREWLDFENLLLSKALDALEFRTYELMSLKAEDRLRLLFERNPQLLLDVPAKYIASLLGITEETMSRLKKNTRYFS